MEKEHRDRNPKVKVRVLEEELRVGKRTVETGATRVEVHVSEVEQLIEEPLVKETLEVRHVAVDRFIEHPAQTRIEGDTTVIPIMEEVLVVEKKLRLKEELHITRRQETVTQTQKETVRKEEATVERTDLPRR